MFLGIVVWLAVRVSAPAHCEIPCGIYGDEMRADLLADIQNALVAAEVFDKGPADGVERQRSHQGKRCDGRTPYDTLMEGKQLALQKRLSA